MATTSLEINLPESVGKTFSYSEIDSTQLEAKRKIALNYPVPFIVIAQSQTAGIGRFQRQWYSPRGGIYFTLAMESIKNPAVTLVAGITLVEILKNLFPENKLILKWPNDILADGRKISGILTENFRYSLLIGIGINTFKNGKFRSISCDNDRKSEILTGFLKKIDIYLSEFRKNGFEYFIPKYIDYTIPIGSEIEVFTQNRKLEGFFSGINGDGSLILERDGKYFEFASGEVSLKIGEYSL